MNNPILNSMIEISNGNFDKSHNQYLYPIIRWNSGNDRYGAMPNFDVAYMCNRYMFFVPPKMIMSYLNLGLKFNRDSMGNKCLFLKYPKSTTKPNKKYDIIVKYLKHLYSWGQNDIEQNHKLIMSLLDDKVFLDWLNSKVGFEKDELKVLGLNRNINKPKQ